MREERVAQPQHERPRMRPQRAAQVADAERGADAGQRLERDVTLGLAAPQPQPRERGRHQQDQPVGDEQGRLDVPGRAGRVGVDQEKQGLIDRFQEIHDASF
ncbi:hypothetical protein HMPREF0005_04899 [Achromobacter xylosoxidans C54]|nr:hypothetical protein HMPREF0005_04899 [Achromobacter xylosoxidans C54]